VTDATLLKKVEELSARVATLETENTRLQTENRLLRQKLDQYIRHYFGGQRNEGLNQQQMEMLLQGLPNVIALPVPEPKPAPLHVWERRIRCGGCWPKTSWRRRRS
jgi:hypothetical protein